MTASVVGTEIVEIISEFNFQNVADEWTKQVWDSNFNDVQSPGEQILEEIMEAESIARLLNNCASKCRRYVVLGGETNFWTEIAETGRLKPFVAYLYFIIDCALKKLASGDDKRNGLLAADAYVSLCAIKGGNAYHIFNASLFQKSLDALKTTSTSLYHRNSSQGSSRGRRGRGRGARANMLRSPSIGSETGGNQDEFLEEIGADELKTLVRNFLKTIWLFVGQFSLIDHTECIETLSASLCRLLNITSDGNDSTIRAEGEYDLSDRSPAGLSFAILHKLFDVDSDDKCGIVARYVFKNLLPHLLMVSMDGRHVGSSSIPAALVQLRNLASNFVLDLLKDNPNGIAKSVYVILQHLCAKVTDKADYRAKVSELITTLALELPTHTFQAFLQWLNKYSRSSKVGYRAFALDVVLSLFTKTAGKTTTAGDTGQEEAKKLLELCLRLLIGRCSDKAASVRCRALTSLTQILEDAGKRLRISMEHDGEPDLVKQLLCEFVLGVTSPPAVDADATVVAEADEELPASETDPADVTTPTGLVKTIRLLPLLLRRCNDDKTLVRKAGIQALECLITIVPNCLNEEAISVFRHRCMDVAVSVRKQALESMTTLLTSRRDDFLEKAWLADVLALVVDRESAVQDKCVDAFRRVITENLNRNDEEGERAWRLAKAITMDSTTTRYAQRILQHLQKGGLISNKLIGLIEKATADEIKSTAAWFLLAQLAVHTRFSIGGLKNAWSEGALSGNVLNYALKILAARAKSLEPDVLKYFMFDLKRRVETFSLPSENIAEAMNVLWQFLSTGKTENFDAWCAEMGKRCVNYLFPVIDGSASQNLIEEEEILRRLFMLGEFFQLRSATTVNQRNFYMIMAFVAAEKYATIVAREESMSQQNRLEVFDGREAATPESHARVNLNMSSAIRSHAVVALGKLCLQDEAFAKKAVSLLVSELDTAEALSIRNNIIIVLSDLCLRYTSVIDPHIGRISRRLRDPSPLVRKQTLTLLTNLLKEDYLKWKGALLFRFLTALLDADAQIRAFAEFCLLNILLQRQPTMFSLHFLECLFYFNDARHPSWHASVDVEGEDKKEAFALSGRENRSHRLYLYRFMLNQFNDQQRFEATKRICQDILGAVADEIVQLGGSTDEVVTDCLIVLASKEMKLTSLSSSANTAAAEDGEEVDPAAAAVAEAAKKNISRQVKQEMLENVVPTLMSLKMILQRSKRGGLIRLLVVFLGELMKDYKNEMKEILAADRTLCKEIEYDLKRQEKGAVPLQLPQRLF